MKSNACVKVVVLLWIVVSLALPLDMDLVDFKFELVVTESIVIEGEVGRYSLPNSVKEITSVGIPSETNWL